MSTGQTGTLIIRPICAKLTRDTETFGKMDPYCKVALGTFVQKTKIADGAGKFPNWQDQLVFKKNHEDIITVEVWDYDSASKDDLVGSATVPISRMTATRNWEDWIEITHRGTRAGEVRLGCEFTPDGHGAHGAHGQGHAAGPNIIVVQGFPPYPGYPPQQGYPPQPGYPPQQAYPAYPPQQAYPPQPGYPPQQAYPAYPPQQAYPPQPGYPPQNYPPQGYPPQPGYPPQGYPPQPGYPPQGYPQYPPSY